MAQSKKYISPRQLESYCVEAMAKAGMRKEDAIITAKVLVTTDTWGTYTHGSKQLRGLMKNFRDKRMDIGAVEEIVGEGPSWAMYDGHHSMPMVTSVHAMEKAISKAQETGFGFAGVRDSGHYGAAGYYANMAAEKGMIGVSMTNVDPGVSVPGSRVSVLGTNPIAYAVPTGEEKTVFLDIATSVVAASKLFAAQALGKSIPDNWLLDKDGIPTTDLTGYPEEGAIMPMSGHKGYGISLLIEILTGVLAGGAFGEQVTSWVMEMPEPVNQSHCFIAINVDQLMPIELFKQRMDHLIRFIKQTPKAKGSDRIYLPGEMEWDRRDKALEEGMVLPEDAVQSLEGLAKDYDLDIEKIWQ